MAKNTITVNLVNAKPISDFVAEIRDALFATSEFDNYECYYGHRLGTCPNAECFHCRTFKALSKLNLLCTDKEMA